MPTTPIYGLPFEHPDDDEPGITLHGGESGEEDILADAVEAQLQRIDGDVSDLQDAPGWVPIVNGVTITSITNFPIEPGVYSMLHVRLRGWLTDVGRVGMRVNDDFTAGLHRTAWTAYRLDTGAAVDSNSLDTTIWSIAQWSTVVASAEAVIYGTDATARLNYEGHGFRPASGTTIRQKTLSGGDLASPRLLSSLTISSSTGSNVDEIKVWIEGYRP